MNLGFRKLGHFIRELKRRSVYKVAVAYLAVSFLGLQAAQMLVPATTLPVWADDLLLYLAVFGFPVVLVIAWAFEMTPEGIRRTDDLENAGVEPETPERTSEGVDASAGKARTAVKLLVGLGLVAVAASGGWYLTGAGERSEITDRSVAVLPFESLASGENTAFTEGIQTGILSRLSSISGLVVKSRTSVMRYRQPGTALPEIGREMGVAWVVRGEVQESGDQVQVDARLVHAHRDEQVWADTYRRALTAENLFGVQEEITKRIAAELHAQLTPRERDQVEARPTENLEAYRLYVSGRSLLARRTETGIREGVRLFERALERDSSFALAWAGLSDGLSLLQFYRYAPAESVSSVSLGAARRAVELDPRSGPAHASLGIALSLRQEGSTALDELSRAIELQPSYPEAHVWLSWVQLLLGRSGAALEPGRRAVELDPMSPAYRVYLAEVYLARGDPHRARQEARRARELQPEYALAHYVEGLVLHHLGRGTDADSAYRRSLLLARSGGTPSRSEVRAALAVSAAGAGDTAAARSLLEEIDSDVDPFSAGLVHAALGDDDRAFAAFRRVARWESPSIEHVRYFFPEVLSSLRADPRYADLIRTVNRALGLDADEGPRGESS